MRRLHRHLLAHRRLATAAALGAAVALALPADWGGVQRALAGWNVAVWLYLALAGWMMARAGHGHLRQVVEQQADSAATVLALVIAACLVSLVGTVVELGAAKALHGAHAWSHVLLAAATVIGAWLLLATVFSLSYASHFYRPGNGGSGGGLQFPGADERFQPGYADFLYVAVTIAATAQTSDVAITTPAMRRLALGQSLLSFAFNIAVLALAINLAASLF
ncbi:MAG TPA: DUF1345 domain-containing protein [Aquabacterium sp.]|nr:DUF1345 domain-containing protein [Aquabacterium sp.]